MPLYPLEKGTLPPWLGLAIVAVREEVGGDPQWF
jgi:hypothetical protein